MDRRKSLKTLALGTLSTSLLLDACKLSDKKPAEQATTAADKKDDLGYDRQPEEMVHYHDIMSKTFFTPDEMATITILGDIIIPRDEVSGSASDAKVPEFIEFMVKDEPENQVPLRGGLRWLDLQCLRRYEKSFKDCDSKQQMEMVDDIAFPDKVKPGMEPGIAFFNNFRDLVATGFYTSEIGVKDIGYIGNAPNQWNGIPEDVLKQYNMAYTEKELKECVSFS